MISAPSTPRLPRLPVQMLRRTELEAQLDKWAPVTIIHGLRGYGKTVLAASWMERQPSDQVSAIWLNASEDMASPERFWGEVSRCISPGDMPGRPASSGRPTSDPLQAVLDRLLAGQRFVLVVDDFHHIRERELLRDLVALVQRNRQFHLVVCTRGRHPIHPLARGWVDVQTIAPQDLILSPAEVVELAQTMGRDCDIAVAKRIRDAVGGWIAALRVVIDASHGDELGTAEGREYVRSAVLPEIVSGVLPLPVLRFTLARRLERRMVSDLCGGPAADQVLQAVESSGLVDRTYENDQELLSLPTVIRTVLSDLYVESDPDGAKDFHRRLGRWYLDHDDVAEHYLLAFQHAVDGHDWDTAEEIWSEQATNLVALSAGDRQVAQDHPGRRLGAPPEHADESPRHRARHGPSRRLAG